MVALGNDYVPKSDRLFSGPVRQALKFHHGGDPLGAIRSPADLANDLQNVILTAPFRKR